MKVHLLVIDPQNDFCITSRMASIARALGKPIEDIFSKEAIASYDYKGALVVDGAEDDMTRLSAMLRRLNSQLDDIHVTMDSHRIIDVAHPKYWRDSAGKNPDPFTIITVSDVESGVWTPTIPSLYNRSLAYVKSLATIKPPATEPRYPLCVWPAHCLIGSWGHALVPEFHSAITDWEASRMKSVDFVTKGSNVFTEHYSAVMAEVPDPKDTSTQLNTSLIDTLRDCDIIAIAGEALSHCLANTVRDIANNFGEENIKKMVLLRDATSSVGDPPGTTMFTDMANAFLSEMTARGMQLSTTVDFLK